jgi:hypothetical protein
LALFYFMKISHLFIPILLLILPFGLSGMEVSRCQIVNGAKHQFNCRLLHGIIEKELAAAPLQNPSPQSLADLLSEKISRISLLLLEKGFAADAYALPSDTHAPLCFDLFTLWEGRDAIPLTFVVYAWPSEEFALNCHAENSFHATSIHSHPCSCALAVLQGTIVQQNYERAPGVTERAVRLISEETFHVGEGSSDDLGALFIHRLIGHDMGIKPCLTLHAYGVSSREKLETLFIQSQPMHTYNTILRTDGTVCRTNW